jgi:hypothetical protein
MRRTFKAHGNDYSSLFELEFAKDLIKRGIPFHYEEFPIKYYLEPRTGKCMNCGGTDIVIEHIYWPDFFLKEHNLYIETKGKFSAKDRTKILSVIRDNPWLDLRLIFMRDNWLTRKHVTKYSDWCKQNNIQYSFLFMPDEWIKPCP